ncbi:DUF1961 family protein [Flexithrix dorotheae]|uniref:DUF1961 family protein n=1 Tax=Flexithrix dorotheae TaxID=70993 RepID=UPI0003A8BB2E|nr:DUF1961 family protein [Flexithrix dorotheae]
MKNPALFSFLVLLLFLWVGNVVKGQQDFNSLNNSTEWKLKFSDDCTSNWEKNWFKDGLISTVEQNENGMNLIAGPVNRNDAHHTVLWTKKSFKGDIKIEYNYTRTDSQIVNVNILYIQAQGIGKAGRGKDITKWNKYREVPTMSKYYYNMNPLHISYAAFPMVNEDPENDYIRVRKYPAEESNFGQTEILPAFFKTGLFLPGETYKITIIKTETKLHFSVKGEGAEEKLYSWDLAENQSPKEGRIGLRHMFTRSAQYSDFKVFTR